MFQCETSKTVPGDGNDNDCDGKIDEEVKDGKDNDDDGLVDEDLDKVSSFIVALYQITENHPMKLTARISFLLKKCRQTSAKPGDKIDNDCDGKIDEEIRDGKDNDDDGLIDEDFRRV